MRRENRNTEKTPCEELGEEGCVEMKINNFCKYLKDKSYCKEQFQKFRNGEISIEQLSSNLKSRFSEQEVEQAKRRAQSDMSRR